MINTIWCMKWTCQLKWAKCVDNVEEKTKNEETITTSHGAQKNTIKSWSYTKYEFNRSHVAWWKIMCDVNVKHHPNQMLVKFGKNCVRNDRRMKCCGNGPSLSTNSRNGYQHASCVWHPRYNTKNLCPWPLCRCTTICAISITVPPSSSTKGSSCGGKLVKMSQSCEWNDLVCSKWTTLCSIICVQNWRRSTFLPIFSVNLKLPSVVH